MAGIMVIDIAKKAKGPPGKKAAPEYANEDGEDSDEYAEVKASAAADAFAAVKDDDEEGFASALNDFVEACVADKLAKKKG